MEGEAQPSESAPGSAPEGQPPRPPPILETTARPVPPPPPPFSASSASDPLPPPPSPPPPPPPGSDAPAELPQAELGWHILCHVSALLAFCLGLATPVANALGLVFPLVVWQMKDADDASLGATAKSVFDFQLNVLVLSLVTVIVTCCVGVICLPVFQIANVVFTILAAVRAANGKSYRYPCVFRALGE